MQAHPHADDENTVRKPVTMGIDNELERLVEGDQFPRPGIVVALGDTGEGIQLPYGPDGRPMLPGSPDAIAAGCICDPEKNAGGLGVRSEDDRIALVTKDDCEVHRRVPVNPRDIQDEDG